MRKLAYTVVVDEILPIPDADMIVLAKIGGWQTVVKRDEFRVGELAVFCEIDSWIPTELAPFLSRGTEPREFNGVKGERLRTVKLKKVLSQGLLVKYPFDDILPVGEPVAERLGIKKWEMPLDTRLAGMVRGNFPSEIPKTDQERCQNLVAEIKAAADAGLIFAVEEKLEGSSCTFFLSADGEFHVCSRNLSLKDDGVNSFWVVAKKYGVEESMRRANLFGHAIQGELIGPGVQGNIYKLGEIDFYMFDVYSVQAGSYLPIAEKRQIAEVLNLKVVPLVEVGRSLGAGSVDDLLKLADGLSTLNKGTLREGLVWKEVNGGMTFKTISNQYLLRQG